MKLFLLAALLSTTPATAPLASEPRPSGSGPESATPFTEPRPSGSGPESATPADVKSLSDQARARFAAKDYALAEKLATQTYQQAQTLLKQRKLDDDAALPLALGAAIEVQAQVMNARGQKAEAILYLRDELEKYRSTTIRARIQKNLHLINLEGKHPPPLDVSVWLGAKPTPLSQLKGSNVLLFFWAHWCSDCKAEAPGLARIAQEYVGKGLVILAPTQHYGYAARGDDAPPDVERAYIDQVRQRFYSAFPVPFVDENFKAYGVSTTPTLVLIDRAGLVRLYHPGAMSYEDLKNVLR